MEAVVSDAFSYALHRKKMMLRDRLIDVLDKAGQGHGDRTARIHRAVLTEVNDALLSHGRAPVGITTIQRLETTALGHVDYASKFALHLAEFVVDGREGPP